MVLLDVVVAVPGLTGTMPELDKADTAFGETTGDEELASEGRVAIHLAGLFGFAADVESVGRFELHAVGHLEGLRAGLEGGVLRTDGLVGGVELGQEVELLALGRTGEAKVADVLD